MKKKEEEEWQHGSDAKDLSAWVGPGHGGAKALATAPQHMGQPKAD